MRVTALAIFCLSLLTACASKEMSADMENCKRLEVGMPLKEVIAIMGQPKSQATSDDPELILYYSEQGYLVPGPVTVWLNGADNDLRVEHTACEGPP